MTQSPSYKTTSDVRQVVYRDSDLTIPNNDTKSKLHDH